MVSIVSHGSGTRLINGVTPKNFPTLLTLRVRSFIRGRHCVWWLLLFVLLAIFLMLKVLNHHRSTSTLTNWKWPAHYERMTTLGCCKCCKHFMFSFFHGFRQIHRCCEHISFHLCFMLFHCCFQHWKFQLARALFSLKVSSMLKETEEVFVESFSTCSVHLGFKVLSSFNQTSSISFSWAALKTVFSALVLAMAA